MIGRRRFLQSLVSLGVVAAAPLRAQVNERPRFLKNPFSLGVASGYPQPASLVLWTRLAPAPDAPGGGMAPEVVAVRWELARDDRMRDIVASGVAHAEPQWAHSVHVEVPGLQPERPYWYRFSAGDAQTAPARTRTAPAADGSPSRLRFAFASCAQYEQGYFGAYAQIAADAQDLVVHLGDYIYESSWGREHVRKHNAPQPVTLDDYRVRYALYKSDPDLQAAHANAPWLVTWDDHEVSNDYADDRSEHLEPREWFLARRAAAYRAWYEHMPVPRSMAPLGPQARIYTRVDWGGLASFFVLDDRQFRSHQVCPRPGRGGANTLDVAECPALADPQRTLLGAEQERWLEGGLGASRARWNVLAQQTMMAQLDQKPGPGRAAWTDGWDGYPLARKKLLDLLFEQRIQNPLVISGDVHSFNVNQLKRDFDDPASPVVASEFVGSSITSQAWSYERMQQLLPDNPHIVFTDNRRRGYVRMELTQKRCLAELRAMDSVKIRGAGCSTLASFVVEDGRPGPLRASAPS